MTADLRRDPRAVRVILASGSPRRRDLLGMIGIEHEVIAADIDETFQPHEEPRAHTERLAREKGEVVARRHGDALVISADTIVVVRAHVLGKPRDEADAARMLRLLSGRTHTVYTAVAVGWRGRTESDVEAVAVKFRPLSDDDVARYIATREPMDKAGAYGIQGYGATIVERIDGDFFAVMGLALGRTVRLMERVGLEYDFAGVKIKQE